MVLNAGGSTPLFCTISSDKHQVDILVLLLQKVWVGLDSIVGGEGDYGVGIQELEYQVTRQGICIAFRDIVPFCPTGRRARCRAWYAAWSKPGPPS